MGGDTSNYQLTYGKNVFLKLPFLLSHLADLHAPAPPDTTAPQTGTRSLQTWLWTGRTCIATACPEMLSRGHACTEHSARWRARCARCYDHLWTGHASSSSVSRPHWKCHHPVRVSKRLFVSVSGKLSEGRSYERKEVWQMSSGERKRGYFMSFLWSAY